MAFEGLKSLAKTQPGGNLFALSPTTGRQVTPQELSTMEAQKNIVSQVTPKVPAGPPAPPKPTAQRQAQVAASTVPTAPKAPVPKPVSAQPVSAPAPVNPNIAPGLPGGPDPALLSKPIPQAQTQLPPVPQAPAPVDNRTRLQEQYLSTFAPSPELTSVQQSLGSVQTTAAQEQAKAQSEYAKRIGAIQEQATLQPFLTGRQVQAGTQLANQLAAIQSGAQAQTIPLSVQLAQMQAQRQEARDRAEAELGFLPEKKAPVVVDGRLVDPTTGTVVYEPAPKAGETYTLSSGQKVFDASGNLIAENAAGGADKTISVAPGNTVIDSAGNVIYRAPENASTAGQKTLTVDQAKNAGFALRMENSMGIIDQFSGAATGVGGAIQSILPGGALTNFLRTPEYQQLDQAQRDFVNATLRRESGAAIAPSEFENAKKQYFPQPGDSPQVIEQKRVNRELALEGVKLGAGENVVETYELPDGTILEKGADGQYYPKANGGTAAATEARRVASAIGQFESGGNYKALGPVLNSGMYKGDRAYGKYQVMGKNVPSWTKEALGVSMTPQQFLADPKAQDKVAEYRMARMIAQGYDVEDIASIWFSGRPLAKAGNAKDQLGTSVPQYAKNVRAIYNRIT